MSVKASERIADFEKPPLIEVALGAQFESNLSSAHLGAFWTSLQTEFPKVEDVPALPRAFPNGILAPSASPSRLFLHHVAGNELIQLQTDRFHVNWKRLLDPYPKFDSIKKEFFSRWGQFVEFCERRGSALRVASYEMTYVNHIESEIDRDKVFPWLDLARALHADADLDVHMKAAAKECNGDIMLRATTGARLLDNAQVLIFELTVRGTPRTAGNADDFGEWADAARERIVTTFVNATASEVRKNIWREVTT
jgi:uncharacterized protein (TIGR04255 family)